MTSSPVPTYCLFDVPGAARAARLAVLVARLPPERLSLIIEGSDGIGIAGLPSDCTPHVLAPGCPCCMGNLTMRVTLARVLRLEAPHVLVLALIDATHRETVRQWLAAPPYDALLELREL